MFDQNDAKYLTTIDPPAGETAANTGNKVSYSSYPRMGNSFLRKYLQNITGVATGSDMALEFDIDFQL